MDFGKVITAMVTPFDEDLNVDFKALEILVEHLINTGTDTILVAGTTGESPTLTDDEKLELFKATKSIAGGRAKIMVAMMPGTTPTPNSMTIGTRYTKDGIVCMISRSGRMTARKISLRAAAMPSGMPITTQKSTAVTTIASVVMVSGQRPITSMNDRATSVNSATPRPAVRHAISASALVKTSIGVAFRKADRPLSTWVIGHCIERKKGRKFGTSQSRTSELTQSAKGSERMSAGLHIAIPFRRRADGKRPAGGRLR